MILLNSCTGSGFKNLKSTYQLPYRTKEQLHELFGAKGTQTVEQNVDKIDTQPGNAKVRNTMTHFCNAVLFSYITMTITY